MLVAFGWSNPRIAAVLYIDSQTLTKHYRPELKHRETARDRLNALMAEKFWELFERGNVRAGCEFRTLMLMNDQAVEPLTLRFGKKQRALFEAQRPDLNSPLGELVAARDEQNVGSELSGLARPNFSRSLASPRSTAQ